MALGICCPVRSLRLNERRVMPKCSAALLRGIRVRRSAGLACLFGAAIAVVAVTLHDASLGDIGSAVACIEILNPQPPIAQDVGQAAVESSALKYAPSPGPSAIVPILVARRESATANAFEAEVAEDILQSGSQRFDLAFAGVARPSLEATIVTGNAGLSVPKPLIANAPLTASVCNERRGAYHTINSDFIIS